MARLVYENGKIVLTDKKDQDWNKITYSVFTQNELDKIFKSNDMNVDEKLKRAGFVACTQGDYIFAEQRYAICSILSVIKDHEKAYKDAFKEISTFFDTFTGMGTLFLGEDEKQYYRKYESLIDQLYHDDVDIEKLSDAYYTICEYKRTERCRNNGCFDFEFHDGEHACRIVLCNIGHTDISYGRKVYHTDSYIGIKLDFDYLREMSYIASFENYGKSENIGEDQKIINDILLYIYKETRNEDVLEAMYKVAKAFGNSRLIFEDEREPVEGDDDDIPF